MNLEKCEQSKRPADSCQTGGYFELFHHFAFHFWLFTPSVVNANTSSKGEFLYFQLLVHSLWIVAEIWLGNIKMPLAHRHQIAVCCWERWRISFSFFPSIFFNFYADVWILKKIHAGLFRKWLRWPEMGVGINASESEVKGNKNCCLVIIVLSCVRKLWNMARTFGHDMDGEKEKKKVLERRKHNSSKAENSHERHF